MGTYWIKEITAYNDQLTIQLYVELQYADGIARHITVANKEPFNKLKKNDLINIDTIKIANHSSNNWFSEENIVSKL